MAKFTSLRPMLDVPDLPATISFWTDTLGFAVAGRIDDDKGRPTWCDLQRDNVDVMFTSHYHDDEPDEEPHTASLTGSIYLNVDDVDGLAGELKGKVDFAFGPETMVYGMREFAVRDNSGYFLIFGQPVE